MREKNGKITEKVNKKLSGQPLVNEKVTSM